MPDSNTKQPTLTVAVLTLNEAKRIRTCLQSAQFANQLLVVDSGSTDETVAIAKEMGAEVYVYTDWKGFAVQRNRLLKHATGDYVFFLDADEEMSAPFQEKIQEIIASRQQAVWKIQWRMVSFGRELKHLRSISWVQRLFVRQALVEFTGVVHEQARLTQEMPILRIEPPLLHYSRPSVRDSLQKLTQYAVLGAAKKRLQNKRGGVVRGLASAISMFLRVYFLHFAVLCGGAGFLYSFFIALEAFFRYAILEYDVDISSEIKRG